MEKRFLNKIRSVTFWLWAVLAMVSFMIALPVQTACAQTLLSAAAKKEIKKPVPSAKSGADTSPEAAWRDPSCSPPPVTIPAKPAIMPGYTELDRETGLHVTGTPPDIDFARYRLEVSGKVNRPLQLTYDDLRCLPKVTARPELVCPGFFVDVATWSGVPLKHVLGLTGVREGASQVRMTAADGYFDVISLKQALDDSAFLAYEWEGKPLPLLHGFPVRAVLPGQEGNKWVKWLVRIVVY